MLMGESLQESVYRLKNINLFFYPAVSHGGSISFEGAFPTGKALDVKLDEVAVVIIMDNRRVLKLYEDLDILHPVMAAQLINDQLMELLPLYRAAYASDLEVNAKDRYLRVVVKYDPSDPSSKPDSVRVIKNTPDPNEVTLMGLRYAILSLVWLAGALNLEGTHEELRTLADEAARQRDTIYNDEIHHDHYKESVLQYFSLYNRTVLCTALIRTVSRPDLEEKYAAHRKTYSRGGFDSKYRHADFRNASGARFNIDYYNNMLDEDFEAVLAALK